MKKIALTALTTLVAAVIASTPAYALPTYEPFTEYTTQIQNNANANLLYFATYHGAAVVLFTNNNQIISNAMDLATNLVFAPSGEAWTPLNFNGTATAAATTNNTNGLDIYVVSNATIFTANNLSTILPATFPGFPASGGAITDIVENPSQPAYNNTENNGNTGNIVGNPAVLNFANDITRPSGTNKTLYISFLWNLAQQGQLATGNAGRFLDFVASSNLVEGYANYPAPEVPPASIFYKYWPNMFNTFGTVRYGGLGVLSDVAGTSAYLGPVDSSTGKPFSTTPAVVAYGTSYFVVESYMFNGNGGKDSNLLWLNPATSSFGGAAPAATTATNMAFNMSDIGGLVIEDRVGSGASGGVGTNYLANLLVGSTWSYVTGGPEFGSGPGNVNVPYAGNATLSAIVYAANQGVGTVWQKVTPTTTNTVSAGAGGAGGSATVSFATNATSDAGYTVSMTLTGIASGDFGSYQVVGTASGTGYNLTSSVGSVEPTDPTFTSQPQPVSSIYGSTVSFSAGVQTSTGQISYAWYDGATMLVNGTLPDGTSTGSSAEGTLSANTGTLTLTLTGISYQDIGNYSLHITNGSAAIGISSAASLAVADPDIVTQPPAVVEAVQGGSATIPVSAIGSGVTYQWNWNNGNGNNVNNGEISGATTSALTINPVSTTDVGTYTVAVNGASGQTPATIAAVLYIDTAPTSVAISPPQWTQAVGTHLAIVGTTTGGSGVFNYIWEKNGAPLPGNGQQGDGSFVFGQNAQLIGVNSGVLILSNLQTSDTGTYTLISSNAGGQVTSGNCVITVEPPGYLTLSSNNLVVTRVGDGAQPLSGATGNTLYLDQYTITGTYSNTIMAPDTGPSAIVVAGGAYSGGNEGAQEAYLTLSSNQEYLNFGGFCYSYPYTGGPNVTVGGAGDVRGIYALNASGTLALVYTNYGLYSGGNGFRSVYSTDGLTNFWTTGSASGGTVKYVNAGPAGAAYTITTPGSGIPGLPGVAAPSPNSGGVVVGLCGTNITFSDNETDGDAGVTNVWGLDAFISSAPEVAPAPYTNLFAVDGSEAHPCDFSFSPDLMTVYVADDDSNNPTAGNFGGIQRWDFYTLPSGTSPSWNFTYLMQDTTGSGTNGCRGLTVYWPSTTTSWGAGSDGSTPVAGAVLYTTTSESSGNRIVQMVDNGGTANFSSGVATSPPPTETLLVTAPPNQFYRGIRFGPIVPQVAVTASVASSPTAVAGQPVEFSATLSGIFAYYFPNAAGTAYNLINTTPTSYQWYTNGTAIPNATSVNYDISNVQTSNAGTYTFVVTTGAPSTPYSSGPVVLSVSPFNPNSSGLVGWWKLSDGSGTNAADSSTYGDTGAIWVSNSLPNPPGNPDWVSGLGGMFALDLTNVTTNAPAADTNNNDNVVLVPDAPQLNFSNNLAFTLAAWVQNATNGQINGAPLIAKGYGGGGEQYTLDIYPNSPLPNSYRFYVRNAGGTAVGLTETSYRPNTNGWDHVAVTYDGNAGVMAMYINGQLLTNITTGVPSSLLANSWPVSIGNRTSGLTNAGGFPMPYDFPLLGTLQDVRVYNAALSQSDIQAIYNLLAPPGILVFSNSLSLVVDNQAAPVAFAAPQYAATPDSITFEITNTGPVTLNVGTVAVPAGFTVTVPPPSTIAANSSATFSVELSATAPGTNSGVISIPNNVPLFTPFSFPVTGIITPVATVGYASIPITGQPGAPVLHFSGTAGSTYHVWTTTNVALQPVEATWTQIGSGIFSGGNDTFAAPAGGVAAQYYAITQP